jgi:hypothetical protein
MMTDKFEEFEDYDEYEYSDTSYTIKKTKKIDLKEKYSQEFRNEEFESVLEGIALGEIAIGLNSNNWQIESEDFVCEIRNVAFFNRKLGSLNEDQLYWIVYESNESTYVKRKASLEIFSRQWEQYKHKQLIEDQTQIAVNRGIG